MGEFDPAPLVHSKSALLRSRLNDTMVRLAELPIRTKLLCPMPNIIWFVGAPWVDKNHDVSKKLPLLVTLQKMLTLDSFSFLARTAVPPFSTGGSVERPVTCSPGRRAASITMEAAVQTWMSKDDLLASSTSWGRSRRSWLCSEIRRTRLTYCVTHYGLLQIWDHTQPLHDIPSLEKGLQLCSCAKNE